ncbi:MAG: hypothetical protein JO314_11865 [Acidobacteria bacterium]|nr:hypothetical protein [Acidobacteriota bacterium]
METKIPVAATTRSTASGLLFSWWQVAVYALVFGTVILGLQRLLRHTCENWIPFDCPYYWPVSIFELRNPGTAGAATALLVVAAFFVLYRVLETHGFKVWVTIIFGSLLILGSTLIQGVDVGLRTPVAGDARSGTLVPYSLDGQEYWHDAIQVNDPSYFFGHYNEIQPTLHEHAHTHPPGAVLTYYFLSRVFSDPAFISLAIMLFSVVMTVVCFYRIVRTETSDATAKYMACLIALLPAVEVYYLSTLDAVITSLLIAVVYLFCFGRSRWSVGMAGAVLTASFLLTYVSLFILPVLAGYELLVRRSLKRVALVAATVIGVHAVLYFATGYNAWGVFREASHFENPNGFMLFVEPANYLFTRLEDISEILFFLGPFLLVLFWRGMKRIEFTPLFTLSVLGVSTLLGMFLVGAFRTGETARACAFIYPFLLFPVARLMDTDSTKNARLQLASLVFLQTVGMQSLGTFHW